MALSQFGNGKKSAKNPKLGQAWERKKLELRIGHSSYVSSENGFTNGTISTSDTIGYKRISQSIARHSTCVFTVNTVCGLPPLKETLNKCIKGCTKGISGQPTVFSQKYRFDQGYTGLIITVLSIW